MLFRGSSPRQETDSQIKPGRAYPGGISGTSASAREIAETIAAGRRLRPPP